MTDPVTDSQMTITKQTGLSIGLVLALGAGFIWSSTRLTTLEVHMDGLRDRIKEVATSKDVEAAINRAMLKIFDKFESLEDRVDYLEKSQGGKR